MFLDNLMWKCKFEFSSFYSVNIIYVKTLHSGISLSKSAEILSAKCV